MYKNYVTKLKLKKIGEEIKKSLFLETELKQSRISKNNLNEYITPLDIPRFLDSMDVYNQGESLYFLHKESKYNGRSWSCHEQYFMIENDLVSFTELLVDVVRARDLKTYKRAITKFMNQLVKIIAVSIDNEIQKL